MAVSEAGVGIFSRGVVLARFAVDNNRSDTMSLSCTRAKHNFVSQNVKRTLAKGLRV